MIISRTPPTGVEFSHPFAAHAQSGTPEHHMAHENLFHEPEFAPVATSDTLPEAVTPPPFPRPRDNRARRPRTTRRRTAA